MPNVLSEHDLGVVRQEYDALQPPRLIRASTRSTFASVVVGGIVKDRSLDIPELLSIVLPHLDLREEQCSRVLET